jgi:hypothetical protein
VKIKPGIGDVGWMLAGALMLLAAVLLVLRFQGKGDAALRLASKAKRIELVEEMRVALAAASEAEKSAVMAVTDEDSEKFAREARAQSTEIARRRDELAALLDAVGERDETKLLARFSATFADLQHIDDELLALAVKNTNLKAMRLAFGPAADAVTEMEAALSRLAAKRAGSADAAQVAVAAVGARAAALRIETLIPPHIAEESDAKMDALEARMSDAEREVAKHLDELAQVGNLAADPDLDAAAKSFARFRDLERQILALSRENTNVRSFAISLDRKRNAMFACQAALDLLQQAISKETIAGVEYEPPLNPRALGARSHEERSGAPEHVPR